MTQKKLYPWTALVLLTTLNLLNYIDRSVLFAVQPLVQSEFHLTNAQIGYLTSAFLGFYMIAAPFAGPLADRYSRKKIIVLGAVFWSALTLLTAVTHTYWELLARHTLVGVGEATLSPSLRPLLLTFSLRANADASLAFFIWQFRWVPLRAICWGANSVPNSDGGFLFTSRHCLDSCLRF